MSELPNFPFVNQLDGSPNAQFNCVPASLCACIRYLTGKSIPPDEMKTAVYGPNWINSGTAASAFVAYCAQQGARLYPVESGSPQEAIQQAHGFLAKGLPVVFTQQDDYSSNPNFTHVCAWFKDAPTSLTGMDPFGAHTITFSDDVWAQRLRSNEVWIMEKAVLDLSDPLMAHYFEDLGNERWKCKPNGVILLGANREFYCRYGGVALFGLPLTNEIYDALPNAAVVVCERAIICYEPARKNDNPPIAGPCYLLHLDSGIGQQLIAQPLVKALQAQIQQLQQQLAQEQNAADQIAALQHKLDAIEQVIKS